MTDSNRFLGGTLQKNPPVWSCAHEKCYLGAVRLVLSREGRNGSRLFEFVYTAEDSTYVPEVYTNRKRHHLSGFHVRSAVPHWGAFLYGSKKHGSG